MAAIPHTRPYFPADMIHNITTDIASILSSGRLMMGPFRNHVETSIASFVGTKDAVSLNSATSGLQIALRYAGCRGQEVLVPAASFLTDLGAVLMEGGIPVLVDCDVNTLAIDPKDLQRKLSNRTTAIIWVHLTGYISDSYQEIQQIAKEAGVLLIEDASHAHGASIDGVMAGNLGDVGIFSLYPTKIITSGTGGLLTTNDTKMAKFAREMRIFGKEEETGDILHLGNDWFLDEIRACVAAHQIDALGLVTKLRKNAASRYQRQLSDQRGFRLYRPREGHEPGWYQFPVLFDTAEDADAAIAFLKMRQISCKKIYKPLQREKVFASLPFHGIETADDILNRAVCLPMMADISDEEIDTVCDALSKFRDTLFQ